MFSRILALENASSRKHSNACNISILVLTVLSPAVKVVMLLPLSEPSLTLLSNYGNMIMTPTKSEYFFCQRGRLDLLGTIPSFGITRYAGLLHLARLSSFARIAKLLCGENKKKLIKDVFENRGQYATFITTLLAMIDLIVASVLLLQFESVSPEEKIHTGKDAFWYAMATITTVGYGDYYPITTGGRITAIFIMLAGIGIIGALASILTPLLVGGSPIPEEEEVPEAEPEIRVEDELVAIKNELTALRQPNENKSVEKNMR
jgi:voltage-gated potassium channel